MLLFPSCQMPFPSSLCQIRSKRSLFREAVPDSLHRNLGVLTPFCGLGLRSFYFSRQSFVPMAPMTPKSQSSVPSGMEGLDSKQPSTRKPSSIHRPYRPGVLPPQPAGVPSAHLDSVGRIHRLSVPELTELQLQTPATLCSSDSTWFGTQDLYVTNVLKTTTTTTASLERRL